MVREAVHCPSRSCRAPGTTRTRVVLVQAKKSVATKKKKQVHAAGGEHGSENAAVTAATSEGEATEVVVVQKGRTAYRQARKTSEQRAAEREQEKVALHEARLISPEVASHNFTRVPGRRVILVDGYNVIGSWPVVAPLPTLKAKRERLETALAAYARINKCYVDLVYDSMKSIRPHETPKPAPSSKSHHVIVTYSGKQSADNVLQSHALYWATEGGSTETVVISNDRQVQEECTRPEVDMMAMATPWLLERCAQAEQKLRQQARRKAEEAVRESEGVQRALGVRSLEEALVLPEARLRAAGLSVEKVMQMMMRGI